MIGGARSLLRRLWYRRQFAVRPDHPTFGAGLVVIGGRQIRLGAHFSCWRLCTLAACEDGRIEIGDHVSFNANVYVNACSGGTITIGHDVLVGPNAVFRASDHRFDDLTRPIRTQGHVPGTIVVEDDVWIGANVTIVGGAHIGRGSVVAAGAVVIGEVAPGSVVGGVPARVIRRRGGADRPESA
jgi:galactoside O-acetyltransferase